MATFSDIYDYVLPEVRGVEVETVDFQTRKVCRDFLKKTTLWRETIYLNIVAGNTDYRLVPRSGGAVAGILAVGAIDGRRDGLQALPEAGRDAPGFARDAGEPQRWWSPYPNLISFREPPDASYQLPVSVFKQLTLDIEDDLIPDDAFDNYVETLALGIKAQLQAMPSKPWTDLTSAQLNNTLYNRTVEALRARLRGGGGRANMRVVAPKFAGR